VTISKRTSKSSQQEHETLDGPEELPNMKPMMELEAGKNVWYQAYVLKESVNEAKVRFPREWRKHTAGLGDGCVADEMPVVMIITTTSCCRSGWTRQPYARCACWLHQGVCVCVRAAAVLQTLTAVDLIYQSRGCTSPAAGSGGAHMPTMTGR
jgi:hypothetical protein